MSLDSGQTTGRGSHEPLIRQDLLSAYYLRLCVGPDTVGTRGFIRVGEVSRTYIPMSESRRVDGGLLSVLLFSCLNHRG